MRRDQPRNAPIWGETPTQAASHFSKDSETKSHNEMTKEENMNTEKVSQRILALIPALAIALTAQISFAEENTKTYKSTTSMSREQKERREERKEMVKDRKDVSEQIQSAIDVVHKMEKDSRLNKVLQQSKGVFIVPKYARAGLGVGGRGGEGIALIKENGRWSDPALYNFGGISLGAQAGVETGSIVMILNNDKALRGFMKENNFELTADAGLSIVNYNAKAQATADLGDVTVWSDTSGLFANITVGVSDIHFDTDESMALYGKKISPADIFAGKAKAKDQKVADLKKALGSEASMSGGSQPAIIDSKEMDSQEDNK